MYSALGVVVCASVGINVPPVLSGLLVIARSHMWIFDIFMKFLKQTLFRWSVWISIMMTDIML